MVPVNAQCDEFCTTSSNPPATYITNSPQLATGYTYSTIPVSWWVLNSRYHQITSTSTATYDAESHTVYNITTPVQHSLHSLQYITINHLKKRNTVSRTEPGLHTLETTYSSTRNPTVTVLPYQLLYKCPTYHYSNIIHPPLGPRMESRLRITIENHDWQSRLTITIEHHD